MTYRAAIVGGHAGLDFSVNPELVLSDVTAHVQQDGLELQPDLLRPVDRPVGLPRHDRSELLHPATLNRIS